MQKIMNCLWFDKEAEEAAKFYVSIFKNSKILDIVHSPLDYPGGKKGQVLTVTFELEGQQFMAMNGGPYFKFTEAISLIVNCETQKEIDELWKKLTADGGMEVECSWLKDKYGLSWQINPSILQKWMSSGDPKTTERVMSAFMKMKKFDIETLKRAYEGK